MTGPKDLASITSLAALAFLVAGCGPDTPGPGRPRSLGVLDAPIRPTDTRAQFHYDPDSEVTSYAPEGSNVRVHYATAGRHRTIMDDRDSDGIPDMVEMVASTTEAVWEYWAARGFRTPLSEEEAGVRDDGGDERFDVYLVDFDISSDGYFGRDACLPGPPVRCAGYLVVENDFSEFGYRDVAQAVSILVSHEFFHGVQAAYDAEAPVWWTEATAVWAEEEFDPSQRDFEAFLPGYFERPERSLDKPLPGPVDPFSYGLAIFPRFLSERFGELVIRQIWEHLADPEVASLGDDATVTAMDRALSEAYGVGLSDAYWEFARWNMFTGRRADPERSYSNGRYYPQPAITDAGSVPYRGRHRMFHLASRYFDVATTEPTTYLGLAGVDPSVPLKLAALQQVERGRGGELFVDETPLSDILEVDTDGVGSLLVLVVNPVIEGRSVKPELCVGPLDFVRDCVAEGQGGGDAGVDDVGPGGGGEDSGVGGRDAGPVDAGEADGGTPDDPGDDLGASTDGGDAAPGDETLASDDDAGQDRLVAPGDQGGDDGGCMVIGGGRGFGDWSSGILALAWLFRHNVR